MDGTAFEVVFDPVAAEEVAAWCDGQFATAENRFDAGRRIARRLGANPGPGTITFGFWAPELLDRSVADSDIFLELLRPDADLDITAALNEEADFLRTLLPVTRSDAFVFSAATGVRAGRREALGDFYALVWRDVEGHFHRILDPLAMSLPYGAFAPAEVYDMAALQEGRADRAYFESLKSEAPHKFGPPTSILQLHIPTATARGTLASLTREIERLSERVAKGLALEPADELFMGYDAVQPLPVEPTTVYEAGPAFWQERDISLERLTVRLMRPNTTNWGYDVVIAGMATVNPVLLETGRPDELVDFAAALHNFPGKPKKLILDVVYGHSDNQGLEVLAPHYFAGPNMLWPEPRTTRNPNVRAILLEMQRR